MGRSGRCPRCPTASGQAPGYLVLVYLSSLPVLSKAAWLQALLHPDIFGAPFSLFLAHAWVKYPTFSGWSKALLCNPSSAIWTCPNQLWQLQESSTSHTGGRDHVPHHHMLTLRSRIQLPLLSTAPSCKEWDCPTLQGSARSCDCKNQSVQQGCRQTVWKP